MSGVSENLSLNSIGERSGWFLQSCVNYITVQLNMHSLHNFNLASLPLLQISSFLVIMCLCGRQSMLANTLCKVAKTISKHLLV